MTRPPNELVERMRQADRELGREQLDPRAYRRTRELMEAHDAGAEGAAPSRPLPLRLLWIPAAAAAILVAAWAIWLRQGPPEQQPARSLAGFQLASAGARLEGRDRVRCGGTRCALKVPELETRLSLRREAVVRRRGRQLELISGEVTCEVTPRPRRAGSVEVHVSHGVVEVIGTRFTLRQERRAGGSVTLHRGRIRFVASDGRAVTLEAGQRLSWPLAPPPPVAEKAAAPPVPASQPVPRPRAERKLDADGMRDLLERLERLRGQQRYARAARLLRRSLPRIPDRATRERLSFELGAILTHQLADPRRACPHWKRHLRAFGPRRYGAEVAKAQQQLGCP